MKYTLNAPCTTVTHGLSAAGAKAGVKKYTSDHPPLLCDLIFSNLSTKSNLTSVLRCYTYILDVLVVIVISVLSQVLASPVQRLLAVLLQVWVKI